MEAECSGIRWVLDCRESVEHLKSLAVRHKRLFELLEELRTVIGARAANRRLELIYRRVVGISLQEVAFIHQMRYSPGKPDTDFDEKWFRF
jgi:hypothetical protein